MTRGLVLRPARVDEVEGLRALCARASEAWGGGGRKRVERGAVAAHRAIVAERGGEPVGLAQVSAPADECELELLVVAPEAIGGGVGRLLFAWAVGTARAQRARVMRIVADHRARAFYEHMGASLVSEDAEGETRVALLTVRLDQRASDATSSR